ncbi:hypothetical protein RYX36_010633 [Vicia faba]
MRLCNLKKDAKTNIHAIIDKLAERGLRSLAVSRQCKGFVDEVWKLRVRAEVKLGGSNFCILRDDKQFFVDHPGAVPITTAQGEELRKLINAPAYIECSSKSQQNVKAVFDAAIRVVLQPPKQKKKKSKAQKACSIL